MATPPPQLTRRAVLRLLPAAAGGLLLTAAQPVAAWHQRGHAAIARNAVGLLPGGVPAYFRQAASAVAHGAMDADLFKHPTLPELTRHERPEHFFNLERLGGRALPPDRYSLLQWAAEQGLEARQIGLLPYAIIEWTQRLALSFAEHRRSPGNHHVQSRSIVYAGMLSHYSGDLTMPLHTTVHYNGRVGSGPLPRSDIHARVDGLLDRLPLDDRQLLEGLAARPYEGESLLQAVADELMVSHGRVDRVYELYEAIPPPGRGGIRSPAVRALAEERYRHGVAFTANLFLTSWRLSERITLPSWRFREQ